MRTPIIYQKIKENPELLENLAWSFDFELVDPSTDLTQYQITTTEPLLVLAQDGTGGLFALCKTKNIETSPVLFISSEGQVGKLAYNFKQALSLIVSYPYWRDLLKFSGGGKLEEMKRTLPFLEADLEEEHPDIIGLKKRIKATLELEELVEPVKHLHSMAHTEISQLFKSRDGETFNNLFNTFVVTDNPYWKNKLNKT